MLAHSAQPALPTHPLLLSQGWFCKCLSPWPHGKDRGGTLAVPHAPHLQTSTGVGPAGNYGRDLAFAPRKSLEGVSHPAFKHLGPPKTELFPLWNPRDAAWQPGSERALPSAQHERADSSKGRHSPVHKSPGAAPEDRAGSVGYQSPALCPQQTGQKSRRERTQRGEAV